MDAPNNHRAVFERPLVKRGVGNSMEIEDRMKYLAAGVVVIDPTRIYSLVPLSDYPMTPDECVEKEKRKIDYSDHYDTEGLP